ncbi:MAG: AtzE family amidohydrolase [Sulfuritalea sp.]|nr:AtzE family amidohydrolase [Sulfuritalea sp.]MDP1984164.1 AtzE family amidohydrolase [Sulfuritalea sp.]
MSDFPSTATAIAAAFTCGEVSAREIAAATLERIAAHNPALNAYTAITAERALSEADALDAARARGESAPPLAAVPFAVKNLFDIAGMTTLAGARLLAGNPPAAADATLVQRMHSAGGLLTGALNMDALAYGFTTENTHYGATRNPHDLTRTAGGSSGGSGAAVAAGLVPIALGSDTNGSIRVPASLCGVFGLKPTYGRLPRSGSFPFVHGLDHLGPLAASAADLALAYDALQGPDGSDPACAQRAIESTTDSLVRGLEGLRVARLAGYFDDQASAAARTASERAAQALGSLGDIVLPEVAAARAAAFVITAAEGGALHLQALRERPDDFEPLSRERLLAGALMPALWVDQAQKLRTWFRRRVLEVFRDVDLLIAPATPVTATLLGQETMVINGRSLPTRPSMGLLTQPISFIGLPVAVAPLWLEGATLPIGVQLIAAPWREDICLRAAWALQTAGLAATRRAASADFRQ